MATESMADLRYRLMGAGGGGGGIPETIVDAAGDLIVGTAADTVARLAKGTGLQVLRVSADGTTLEWADPSAGGITGQGTGANSVLVGDSAVASSDGALAMGDFANAATGTNPIAIGSAGDITQRPSATGSAAIAIGANSSAATAGTRATGNASIAVGGGHGVVGASASGTSSIAIGSASVASVNYAIAIGGGLTGATASADSAVALGKSSTASQAQAIALGANAVAGHSTAVAIGKSATTTAANQIMLGTAAEKVVIPGDLTIAGSSAPRGELGYAEVVADVALGTGSGDIAGLFVTVDVGTSRRIKITGQGSLKSDAGGQTLVLRIVEDATTVQMYDTTDNVANAEQAHTPIAVLTPSAGSHTYKLQFASSGGNITLEAATGNPSFILVEDIGAA